MSEEKKTREKKILKSNAILCQETLGRTHHCRLKCMTLHWRQGRDARAWYSMRDAWPVLTVIYNCPLKPLKLQPTFFFLKSAWTVKIIFVFPSRGPGILFKQSQLKATVDMWAKHDRNACSRKLSFVSKNIPKSLFALRNVVANCAARRPNYAAGRLECCWAFHEQRPQSRKSMAFELG